MVRMKKRGKSKISQNSFFTKNRKGVSPVIATVMLISMVIIIGIIIFLWFRGMIGESITKFGENIELSCEKVVFDASYSDAVLYISNNGDIPIYDMKIKFESFGNYASDDLSKVSDWNLGTYGLRQGKTFSGTVNIPSSEKITLTPILLGSTENAQKTFACDEKQFGLEIIL